VIGNPLTPKGIVNFEFNDFGTGAFRLVDE
jgi:hypothetical protein